MEHHADAGNSQPPKKNNTLLIVFGIIGALFVIAILVIALIFFSASTFIRTGKWENDAMIWEDNLKKYGDDYEEEGKYILDTYCFNPDEWNYRFCNNYSQVVPEGELGDIHLSIAIDKISGEEFKKLKASGFSLW